MRVLFSAPPSPGHLLPALPTLQALQAAGHEVLIAGYGGDLSPYLRLGLSVADIGDETTLAQMYERYAPGARFGRAERTAEGVYRAPAIANAALCRRTVAPLLKLVLRWSPDLLIHDPFQGAIPLVAAMTGTPVVEHQSGLLSGRVLTRMIATHLADLYETYRAEVTTATASIEVTPPSLHDHDDLSLQTRYVSQHGSAVAPAGLLEPSFRQRVVVSFGTVLGAAARDEKIAALLPVLDQSDAEFLLPAADDADPEVIGLLPDNVRLLPWIPVSAVLRWCHGVIHHGGAGTLMSAVAAGLPQLIVPQAGDQYFNADAAERGGFGVHLSSIEDIQPAGIGRILDDEKLRAGAVAIRVENAAQPAPAALVPRLRDIADHYRAFS